MNYRLSRETQLGIWANDFARSPRLGISFGAALGTRRDKQP
jgi:hypothetical protein